MDLPGIEEASLSVQLLAYLENELTRRSLIPLIVVPLTCGGFHNLMQYVRLLPILQRVKQPITVVFTMFSKQLD